MSQPIKDTHSTIFPILSDEERTYRRLMVYKADHENRLEGITRDASTDPIFEAFICGEIDIEELIPRLKALLMVN